MGSRNHEARDSESPKAPDAGGASETRPSQPAPPEHAESRPGAADRRGSDSDEVEPHVAISFGYDGDGVPPSSGPISRPNIAGRYRLDTRLAEGGMGIVYAGWHVTLDQPVAIKVIQKELINNADAVKRFIEEARALAQLRGPHVAQVLDAGIEDGTPFIVMELLKGRDLRTLLGEQRQMPVTQATQLVREACEAVSEAHAKGIVHRDLKPENLFLAQTDNGASVLKVIDFGISARREADGGYGSHEPGPGSPEYMAPEQLLQGKTIDHRADIWSLGVVLYELLTGNVPFGGETPHAICSAVVGSPPPSLRQARPDVPVALETVVLRCLAKSPHERFADAQELAYALSAFEPAPVELLPSMRVSARPPPVELDTIDSLAPAQLAQRSMGNLRVGIGVAAGCVLGIVGYFATRLEFGTAPASSDPAGVSRVAGGATQAKDPETEGPVVAPVTDSPNVLPILREDAESALSGRRPALRGRLMPVPAPVQPGPLSDKSLEAELDDVGEAVAGLVDQAQRSEEEVVEARYALADAKPKASAEPESPVRAKPPENSQGPVQPLPGADKAPARAVFPDTP